MFNIGRYKGKLSPIEMLVLGSLKEEPLFGNEIIDKLKKQFKETSFIPQSGTIYPIFERLEKKEKSLIISSLIGKKKRKKYELTDEGRDVLKEILRKDDFEKEMAYTNKFFTFIQNIAEIGENIVEIGGNFAEGVKKISKSLELEGLKNDINSFKSRIEYHTERIKIHKARIEKLSQKLLQKTEKRDLLLQNPSDDKYILANGSENSSN